jgi:hypothetical protein
MPWTCGPKCPLWKFAGRQAFGGVWECMGLCRRKLRREGSECRYSLADMEADHTDLTAAIAARRAEEPS